MFLTDGTPRFDDARYAPTDTHNFLRNWTKAGPASWQYMYHPADADKPVVHVSLTEARLYCQHYGFRLPHTWEWSYAAQGTDGRAYPWGQVSGCKRDDAACLARSAVDGSHCPLLQVRTHEQQQRPDSATLNPLPPHQPSTRSASSNVSGSGRPQSARFGAGGAVGSAPTVSMFHA